MNKPIAAFVAVTAIVAAAAGAYIYTSAEMEITARRAISNAGTLLFRDPSRGKIEYGAVKVDVLASRVDVADVVISIDGRPVRTIANARFGVERFTGRLGDVELVSLHESGPIPGVTRAHQGEIKRVAISGLGADAAELLARAARRDIDPARFIETIAFERFAVEGVDVKVDGRKGPSTNSLASLVIEGMAGGQMKHLVLSDLRVSSGAAPGHVALGKLEINDFAVGRIARAMVSNDPTALMGSLVLSRLNVEDIEVGTDKWRFSLARARLASRFATTDKGERYASGSTLEISRMVFPLISRDARERRIIEKLGVKALETDIGMKVTGDHKSRTMTLDDFRILLKELAGLQIRYRVSDVPEEAYSLGMTKDKWLAIYGKLGAIKLDSASLVVTNTRLVQTILDEAVRASGTTREQFIADMVRRAKAEPRYRGNGALAGLVDKFADFLRDPKVMRITVAPPGGLRFDRVLTLYMTDPGQLMGALNLEVTVN